MSNKFLFKPNLSCPPHYMIAFPIELLYLIGCRINLDIVRFQSIRPLSCQLNESFTFVMEWFKQYYFDI